MLFIYIYTRMHNECVFKKSHAHTHIHTHTHTHTHTHHVCMCVYVCIHILHFDVPTCKRASMLQMYYRIHKACRARQIDAYHEECVFSTQFNNTKFQTIHICLQNHRETRRSIFPFSQSYSKSSPTMWLPSLALFKAQPSRTKQVNSYV